MQDDFSKLEDSKHMLEWLADNPFEVIRSETEQMFREQLPDSNLRCFRVISDPQWLTGARKSDDNPDLVMLIRTGVAFQCEMQVDDPSGAAHQIRGIFTWVGVHLDDTEKRDEQIWFDLDGTLEEFGSKGTLAERMYFE